MIAQPHSRPRRHLRALIGLVALALVGAVVWLVLTIGNPFPPRTLVMATGSEGSASYEFGIRYRELLRRSGVDLRLEATGGGVENLARLRDPRSGVGVAFVEGGLAGREESSEVASLGTVSVEPLWFFRRRGPRGTPAQRPGDTGARIRELVGRRISIGPEGSATRLLARHFLALNDLDETNVDLRGLTEDEGADALLRGDVDAVVLLTSWQSPAVRRLMLADGIVLETWHRADAYIALFPSLSKLVLPLGVADLARNIPPTDVQLLAASTNLAVRADLHPAVQYLLLEAAAEIHGEPEVFHRPGRFPAPEVIDLPLSVYAREYYKSGRPFVYRVLPFWLASLAERVVLLLVPLVVVVLPVFRFVPSIYAFIIERRIYRLYGELKILETALDAPGAAGREAAVALDELAKRAAGLQVPLAYAQRLFILKNHIALAQQQARRLGSRGGTG